MNRNPPAMGQVTLAPEQGRLLKETQSLCPRCLEPIPARVHERSGEVWMDKDCPEHGAFSALLSSDVRHYYQANPAESGGACCGSSCAAPLELGDQRPASGPWANHSCTVLIEIIERCNLSCPTCFAGSSPQHSGLMEMAEFRRQVDELVAGGKRGSDMIQLSGGEPTIHPRLFDMVDYLFDSGFHHVTINSNGIKLARPAWVEELARRLEAHPDGKLFIYLQFDGFEESTHEALRGRPDLLDIKERALDNCHARGVRVHPVMTLTRGINDHEVGDFVRLAVDRPWLKNVVLQPAMYSGRYGNPRRQDRITLADTVGLVCDQFGTFEASDFMPIPCSDPNCFGMALALRTSKRLLPVSRYFPRYEEWGGEGASELMERFADTINGPEAFNGAMNWAGANGRFEALLSELDEEEVDELLQAVIAAQSGGEALWERLLTISIKPFMDAWTYDQDRIDACCVHILDPQGNPISFCEYNAVHRPRQETGPLSLNVRTT